MRTLASVVSVAAAALISASAFAQTATVEPVVATSAPASAPATSPAKTQPASQPTLKAAQQLYWKGDYKGAIAMYQKLSGAADAVEAALGLYDAYMMTGQYEPAKAALQTVAAAAEKDPHWHADMAGALAAVGEYDKALAEARKDVAIKDDWAPAIACLGQLLETVGKKKEAVDVYKTIEKVIAGANFTRDAESLVAVGEVMDRLAILTGKKASEQGNNILQNYMQKAYQDAQKDYWPANVAAGQFLLSKHKPAEAMAEFKLAAKVNKNLPDIYVGVASAALEEWKFEDALKNVDQALAINPNHADAQLVKAACNMQWRKLDEVPPIVEKILAVNPNHLEALSMMASVYVRKNQPDKANEYIQRVQKINPGYAGLYEAIGNWLSSARQFSEAETNFKKAMDMSPELAGPVTALGLMYMQTGQEALARDTLNKAFGIDDFRADVLNYLKLLDALAKFEVRETPHFIVKVDPAFDAAMMDWLVEQCEKIHTDVARDFNFTPPDKTTVEIFPNHHDFSVRVTGKGWIGTVGACTGRVIAMPAPDPLRGGFGTFNWAVVLRHEYTHAVTLGATENRIPHWFTEACAVWEQPDRRNYEAVQLLVNAVQNGKLFAIKDLDWGFIRPKSPADRSLAYAQSEWIFEYIVEKKNYDTILKMITGYHDNKTQPQVIQETMGMTEEQFDKDFAGWAREQIRSWGFDPDESADIAKATSQSTQATQSADAQARLALAQLKRNQFPAAIKTAEAALKIDPNHKRAKEVICAALTAQKKMPEAIKAAQELEDAKAGSSIAARVLGDYYLGQRKYVEAIQALENYRERRKLDPYAYEKLAGLYMEMGQSEKALPYLIELHHRSVRDSKYARQIADIYRGSATPERGMEYYEQVIQINPYDAGAFRSLSGLNLKAGNYDRAVMAMNSACLLEPKSADSWAQMAVLYYRVGKKENNVRRYDLARDAAHKALELDPTSQAKDVLEMVEQEIKNFKPADGAVQP